MCRLVFFFRKGHPVNVLLPQAHHDTQARAAVVNAVHAWAERKDNLVKMVNHVEREKSAIVQFFSFRLLLKDPRLNESSASSWLPFAMKSTPTVGCAERSHSVFEKYFLRSEKNQYCMPLQHQLPATQLLKGKRAWERGWIHNPIHCWTRWKWQKCKIFFYRTEEMLSSRKLLADSRPPPARHIQRTSRWKWKLFCAIEM